MKSKVFPLIVISLSMIFSSCSVISKAFRRTAEIERPIYRTVFVAGRAPIEIDGDISDWRELGIPPEPLTEVVPSVTRREISGPEDLSAEFMACLDGDYLYVAVQVTDDRLIYGEDALPSIWLDDTVEIYFDGNLTRPPGMYSPNSGHVMISRYSDGGVVLEGRIGLMPQSPKPALLYEACGTACALREATGERPGYIVEIAIPRWIFGPDRTQDKFGFNVMVDDDDDGGDRDGKLSWSNDPENMSPRESNAFGVLSIERVLGERELGSLMAPEGRKPTVPEEFREGLHLIASGEGAKGRRLLERIFRAGEHDLVWKASAALMFCSLERDGLRDDAIPYMKELSRSDISGRARFWALSELAYLYEKRRDFRRAVRLRERILEESDGREISQAIDLGHDYMRFDLKKARTTLEDALESPYINPRIREKIIPVLSSVYVMDYNYDRARNLFEDAFRDPEINREKLLLAYGSTIFPEDNYGAAEAFRELIELKPRSRDAQRARLQLARCYEAMGDRDSALRALEEGFEVAKDDFGYLYRFATCLRDRYREFGKRERLRRFEERYSILFPAACERAIAGGGGRALSALRLLGDFYMRRGKYGLARKYLRKRLEMSPDDPVPYLSLGDAFIEKGLYRQAVEVFRDFLKIAPESAYAPQVLLKLSDAYRGAGDPSGAKSALEELVERYPGSPEAGIARSELEGM